MRKMVDVPSGIESVLPFWRRDFGGLRGSAGDRLYFFGVIDILTHYGKKKQLEHVLRVAQ